MLCQRATPLASRGATHGSFLAATLVAVLCISLPLLRVEALYIPDSRCDYDKSCSGGSCTGDVRTYQNDCPWDRTEESREVNSNDCFTTSCGDSCPSGTRYDGCQCADCFGCGGWFDRNCNNGGRRKERCCRTRVTVQCVARFSCTYIPEGPCGPIAPAGSAAAGMYFFNAGPEGLTTCQASYNGGSCPSGETPCGCIYSTVINGVKYGGGCCCTYFAKSPPPSPSPPPPSPPPSPSPPVPPSPPYITASKSGSSGSSGSSLSAEAVTPSSTSSSRSGNNSGGSSSSGVSGGAIAGIVIGVLAGLAVLAAAGVFMYRRRRAMMSGDQQGAASASAAGHQPAASVSNIKGGAGGTASAHIDKARMWLGNVWSSASNSSASASCSSPASIPNTPLKAHDTAGAAAADPEKQQQGCEATAPAGQQPPGAAALVGAAAGGGAAGAQQLEGNAGSTPLRKAAAAAQALKARLQVSLASFTAAVTAGGKSTAAAASSPASGDCTLAMSPPPQALYAAPMQPLPAPPMMGKNAVPAPLPAAGGGGAVTAEGVAP